MDFKIKPEAVISKTGCESWLYLPNNSPKRRIVLAPKGQDESIGQHKTLMFIQMKNWAVIFRKKNHCR